MSRSFYPQCPLKLFQASTASQSENALSSRHHLQSATRIQNETDTRHEVPAASSDDSSYHSGSCLFSGFLRIPPRLPGNWFHGRLHCRLRHGLRRCCRWYTWRKPRVTAQYQPVPLLRVAQSRGSPGVSIEAVLTSFAPYLLAQLTTLCFPEVDILIRPRNARTVSNRLRHTRVTVRAREHRSWPPSISVS